MMARVRYVDCNCTFTVISVLRVVELDALGKSLMSIDNLNVVDHRTKLYFIF